MIRSAPNKPASDSSYTAAALHTTAAALNKRYEHEFPLSENADKQPDRREDGHRTSGEYARDAEGLLDSVTMRALQIDYHHPLENWLGRRPFRWLLGKLSKVNRNGRTALERIITSYRNPAAALSQRVKYWPIHGFIDRMRGEVDVETFRKRLAGHAPTVRGLVIVARSLAEFGLQVPQKFVAPLFAVWNFTNRCNLACKHCYQDSLHGGLAGELTLEEKLDLVDQMGSAHLPMLALSGGEPTMSPHLLDVLRRASGYDIHLTLATNGTTITPKLAAELVDAGLRYVEISLDSVDPARHDAFRGREGLWERTIKGAKTVAATEGLRLGIAMCIHQSNFHEARDMLRFAEDLGASCFAHFNFIPVGRGLKMVSGDITPAQREELLAIWNEKMQAGGMGIISTAPQLGRVCMAGAALDGGRVSCSHAGSGSGVKARVVPKYLGGCGAGRTYVCVEPGGDITPCVYIPHRIMGNIREKPFLDIYRNSIFWQILNDRDRRLHHCEVCAFRNYCGGCRARADAYFGQLHAGDPGCIFNEKHWEKLVADGVAAAPQDRADPAEVQVTPTRHGLA